MFGESMIDNINDAAVEGSIVGDLNDFLEESAEDMFDELENSAAIEAAVDISDLDEDLDEDFDPNEDDDGGFVPGVDDDPDPLEEADNDYDDIVDAAISGTFPEDDLDEDFNPATEQLDVIDPVNTPFHDEIDLEDSDWDSFFNFESANEAVHPVGAAITTVSQIGNIIYGIPTSIATFFVSAEIMVSLFLMSIFDKLAYQNRINDLKKDAKKEKDPVKRKKLEDKAARADYVRKFASGFIQKNPIDKKLNKPNLFDKALAFFNDVNYGISDTYITHLEKQYKKHAEKGDDLMAATYKSAATSAKSRVLESAIDEMFNFDFDGE